jgi:hypothetical protein
MPNRSAFDGRVIFDHLPKTAGQAVNAWLTNSLGKGCVTPNLIGGHRELINRYGGDYSVISGHMAFQGEGLDSRYRYLTCFREPIDRAISWMFFVFKNLEKDQLNEFSVEAKRFFETDGEELGAVFKGSISNIYVEHFAAAADTHCFTDDQKLEKALRIVENYDVWGLYEHMPRFLADVAELIGLPAPETLERVNVTRERLGVNQINDRLRARLEALNSLDLQLYAELKRRYELKPVRLHGEEQKLRCSWLPYEKPKDREYLEPGVVLLRVGSSNSNVVVRGEIIRFEVDISLAEPVNELEVGIHVFDSEKRWAFGVNSSLLSRVLKNHPAGLHRFSYYFVADLPDGAYTIGFAAAEKAGERPRELAWFDRLLDFRVETVRRSPGVGYADLPVEFASRSLSPVPALPIDDAKGRLSLKASLNTCVVGGLYQLEVELFNLGKQAWCGSWGKPIHISYRWLDLDGNVVVSDGLRTPLPAMQLLPSDSLRLTMAIAAPMEAGIYRLMLLPVQEHCFWFDGRGFIPEVLDVAVCVQGERLHLFGSHCAMGTQVGRRSGGAIVGSGVAGFLLYGPYLTLPAGQYRVLFVGKASAGAAAYADVVADSGCLVLGRDNLAAVDTDGVIAEFRFRLEHAVSDLETRIWIDVTDCVTVDAVLIEPHSDNDVSSEIVRA